MKRNVGIIILLISQLLKANGIDLNIGEAEITTISSAVGLLLGCVGTVQDLIRKNKLKKLAESENK